MFTYTEVATAGLAAGDVVEYASPVGRRVWLTVIGTAAGPVMANGVSVAGPVAVRRVLRDIQLLARLVPGQSLPGRAVAA